MAILIYQVQLSHLQTEFSIKATARFESCPQHSRNGHTYSIQKRWFDRVTSDYLKLPLLNLLFGLIIDNSTSSIKFLFQFDAISKSMNSSPLFHSIKWQNNSNLSNRIQLLDLPNYTHLLCSRQLVECAHLDRSINPKK